MKINHKSQPIVFIKNYPSLFQKNPNSSITNSKKSITNSSNSLTSLENKTDLFAKRSITKPIKSIENQKNIIHLVNTKKER